MKYRPFGQTDIQLPALGLGCMGMSHGYGNPNDTESIATLEKAIDIGMIFWDTADSYANGKNEELISTVLKPNRDKIFIATKFGFKPFVDGQFTGIDGSPEYIRKAVDRSLQRLRTDVIDLYYAHRIDPQVPVEETVGAMADLVQQGKVRFLGLSEASPSTIRRAHKVHPISALQSEYSLLSRDVETEILPLCKELKITLVPFSPLSRGLMTNTVDAGAIAKTDFRANLPRFQPEYEENNKNLAQGFAQIARKKGCTPAQLALAWVLSRDESIIPIPGTKKRNYLLENAAAIDVTVTAEDSGALENLVKQFPNTGPRYNEHNMRFVDKSY